MDAVVRKVCSDCGLDVAQQKRVKDPRTNLYYCPPCWEAHVRAAQHAAPLPTEEATLVEPIDDLPDATTDSRPKPATAPAGRLSKGERQIIHGGVVVGVLLFLGFIYLLFLRNWWEDHNRENLLTLKQNAEVLAGADRLAEAKQQYDQLFSLVGDHEVAAADLRESLKDAHENAAKVASKLAAEEHVRQEAEEKREAARITAEGKQVEEDFQRQEQARKVAQEKERQARLAEERKQAEVQSRELYATGLALIRGTNGVTDQPKGFQNLKQAAELGLPDAMGDLGWFYIKGIGTEKDEATGFGWLSKGAEAGFPPAMANLGYCFLNGSGVEKDVQKAVAWFAKGAAQNDPLSMFDLGVMYANGLGVDKDEQQAETWWKKAADLGNPNATAMLQRQQLKPVIDLLILYATHRYNAQLHKTQSAYFKSQLDLDISGGLRDEGARDLENARKENDLALSESEGVLSCIQELKKCDQTDVGKAKRLILDDSATDERLRSYLSD